VEQEHAWLGERHTSQNREGGVDLLFRKRSKFGFSYFHEAQGGGVGASLGEEVRLAGGEQP